MTPREMATRIVRYGELIPCRTAFIDAHTPGSDQKENFTIIGAGVAESSDQHVHIRETPGFNIGAAGQPPKCRNSLHSHRTAEVFFVLGGRWRFFWGRHGDAGEVVLERGDIINLPTGMFRGFENVGSDYAMIMAILGGDDAGGGVVWAPEVIADARDHGLVLGENGRLYDTTRGESLPDGVGPMPPASTDVLNSMDEPSVDELVGRHVARYLDLAALARGKPAAVIGPQAVLRDRPGFSVEMITSASGTERMVTPEHHRILMPLCGHWRATFGEGETSCWSSVLNPGDTCAVPPGMPHSLVPSVTGEAALYMITGNDDPAGPTVRDL